MLPCGGNLVKRDMEQKSLGDLNTELIMEHSSLPTIHLRYFLIEPSTPFDHIYIYPLADIHLHAIVSYMSSFLHLISLQSTLLSPPPLRTSFLASIWGTPVADRAGPWRAAAIPSPIFDLSFIPAHVIHQIRLPKYCN